MARLPQSPFAARSLASHGEEEGSTLLFFILPPLLVAAVFAFCAYAPSDAQKYSLDEEQEESLQTPQD